MSDDWKNLVIETGVDTLLKYLATEKEASVSQISKDIGVSNSRIKNWAQSLEKQGLIEVNYSITKGMILEYTEDNKEEMENKIEMLDEQIEDKSVIIKRAIKERNRKLREVKKELKTVVDTVETMETEENKIKKQIQDIKDLEEKIEEEVDVDQKIEKHEIPSMKEIQKELQSLEIDELNEFEFEADKIAKNIKAQQKLQNYVQAFEDPVDAT